MHIEIGETQVLTLFHLASMIDPYHSSIPTPLTSEAFYGYQGPDYQPRDPSVSEKSQVMGSGSACVIWSQGL